MTNQTLMIRSLLGQTERLADSLRTAMRLLAPLRPVSAAVLGTASDEQTALIDAFALRFGKLQDLLGQKAFRAVLLVDLAPVPASTLDLLLEMERRSLLESVERWRVLRELRNGLTHDYLDNRALAAEILERTLTEAEHLLDIHHRTSAFLTRRLAPNA